MTNNENPRQETPTHIEFDSWEHLAQELIKTAKHWIWRGQENYDWTLATRVGRELRAADPQETKTWTQIENSTIGYFMDRSAGLLEIVPDEHDLLSWLALMQHYNAPTRLLDWSFSPFVGIYFAYERQTDGDAALYALNHYMCRRINVQVLFPYSWDHLGTTGLTRTDADGNATTTYPGRSLYRRDHENEILRWAIQVESRCPLPTVPLQQDARMSAQQTVFTLMGDLRIDIDDWFDKANWQLPERRPGGMIAGTDSTIWPLDEPGQLLKKFRLRHSWRKDALQTLETMGITAGSLFPGLDGIGRAASAHFASLELTQRDVLTGWIIEASRTT